MINIDFNFNNEQVILAGVSGGADSMVLLDLLHKKELEIGFKLVCVHVNHNIRSESDSEQAFLSKYCSDNNVVFESMKIENYGDDNFHNEARTKRYNYFGSICKRYNAKYLFTAHHGDDLTETILMRITRGSNIKGYVGFKEVSTLASPKS